MEMFDGRYVENRLQKLERNDGKGSEKYSPKCSQQELNKMIDFNSALSWCRFDLDSIVTPLFHFSISAPNWEPGF